MRVSRDLLLQAAGCLLTSLLSSQPTIEVREEGHKPTPGAVAEVVEMGVA